MSENGIMDRPRRTTRSSLASSSAGTPGTPSSSNNPYKKPTYSSSTRGESASSSKNSNGTSSSRRGRRGRGRPPGRPSMGSRGGSHSHHHHTKPECIAVRVDGRRSTGGSTTSSVGGRRGATSGGRRSTYSSRHDYEYHYGSDFESDQNESEAEEDEIESEQNESDDAESISLAGDNDNAESDSDYSGSLSRVTTTTVSSSRLPSPPVPIWLDTEKVPDIPKLELPTSSDDLLLSREHVVRAVEVYEPLRRFHQLVRLSPFRFEDFCGALANEDQSSLLAEIHIQLLKVVIREEDANSTLFGPNEVKDSVQSVYFFVDHITWPETLRSYLESDPSWSDVFEAIDSVEYPFCGPAERIKVLGWLVDQFLTTSVVREQLLGDGNVMSEDHCRACNRLGEVICCEQCPAVYHLECITPALKDLDDPPEEWRCPVCVKHEVAGVNDSTSEGDKVGILIRHERLGYDRHGRKYWFLVRRLLVESDDGSEVWYYSTRGQVEELLSQLDAENYEAGLVANIRGIEDELYQQMEVTEEVTKTQNTQRRKTYLDVCNGKDEGAEGGQERVTRLKSTGLYKLGQEGLFRSYTNLFITDSLALSKGKQNEERDRRRYMSHKFSLTTASECKYGIKDLTGCPRVTQVSALRNALTHMETMLPTTLMHVNWPVLRKSWLTAVQTGAKAEDFAKAMIMISACIRNAVYNPVWSESTGHVSLHRMTLMEKEDRKKSEKRDKKDKDDEEDRLKAVPQFIKYTLPIRHQVYKQKGEEYRLHGRWGWIWLSNMRRCKPQDCRQQGLLAGPLKHVIQVKNEMGKVKTMLIDPSVYCKLMAKRNLTTNSKPSTPATTPSKEPVDPQQETTVASIKDRTDSSSSSINEVEMKEASPPPQPKETQEQDLVQSIKTEKVDEEVENGGEKGEDAAAKSNCVDVNSTECEEKSEEKMEEGENEKAPKMEPMEVDSGSCETQSESVTETRSESEKCPPKESQENGCLSSGDSAGEEKEDEKEKENEKNDKKETVDEEIDGEKEKSEKSSSEEPMEVEVDQAEAAQEKKESSEDNNEKADVEEVPLEKVAENGMETETDEEKEKCKETDASEPAKSPRSPTPTNAAPAPGSGTPPPTPPAQQTQPVVAPAAAAANIPAEKIDDSQGRKFKTDLINVSLGLSTPNRILYPKVARRSDYLDTLLQRRLTLMSLEEKQLNNSYGEDMVAKAKPGLVKYEEEEKKRKEEAEEFPGEEVLDDNLVLAGAYTFQCYSSECRREVNLFMKGKGKNRERLYEKICYSPMCRLKFCLQETIRIKQERLREYEKERYWKVYKEIEEKRMFTVEGTTHKIYMKKLPDGLLPALNGVAANAAGTNKGSSTTPGKTKKPPATKYPEMSSYRYAVSKKPSILVLPQFELRKLARTAGRFWTPAGFFQNLKSGSWGWSLPCGRPVFKTAWQFKTTHATSLATAAMQLRILYASIRWDDILAKIPNTEGKHQVHTDTEIITSEILNHRIVGRFLERVQYLRKAMVVPIDAPKTIREVAPSRIGLRKRKRAESPDKMEPVVTEDWVDEERLELWEIRYYGDRINRKHDRRSESSTPSASTRTKSGVAIKQPEKYDPSHNPTQHSAERKTYAPAAQSHSQQQAQQGQGQAQNPPTAAAAAAAVAATAASIASDNLAKTIENVVRNSINSMEQSISSPKSESGRTVSAVKTAELMRETLQTEMKMNRTVHLSKRDSHTKQGGNQSNATNANRQTAANPQPTASQQFQQQLSANKEAVASTPTSSKVGQVVVGKKFFASRQNASAAVPTVGGLETGILTKRPLQNTITINKGVGGAISVVKNPQPAPPPQPVQSVAPGTTICVPITPAVSNPQISNVSTTTVTTAQQQAANAAAAALAQQKFLVIRLPDGRLQVKGLLPGQTCYQTADGKIHVTMSPAQVQQLQQQQAAAAAAAAQQVAVQVPTTAVVAKPPEVVTTPVAAPPTPPVTSVAVSTERKIFVSAAQSLPQQQVQQGPMVVTSAAATTVSTASVNLANAIQSVVRNHELSSSSPKSVVKAETSETEMKMNRAVHLLKKDSPSKQGGSQNNTTNANKQQTATPQQPTASQQFQQQQIPIKVVPSSPATSVAGNAKIVVSSSTISKVGQVIVDKKLIASRQTPSPASPVVGGLETGLLTKRPLQNTIIINKGVAGAISVVKTPQPIPPPQPVQTVVSVVPGTPICVPITQTVAVSNSPMTPITTVSTATVTTPQQQAANAAAAAALVQQKFLVVRLPDGRLQVKGLLPGQTCYQTGDGKIYVTMSPTQVQQIQQQPQQVVCIGGPTPPPPPPQVAVQVSSAAAPPPVAVQVTSPITPVVAKPIKVVATPTSAPATPTVISVAADQSEATRSPIKVVQTPTSAAQVVQQLQQQQQQQQQAAAAAVRQVAAQVTTAATPVAKPVKVVTTPPATAPPATATPATPIVPSVAADQPEVTRSPITSITTQTPPSTPPTSAPTTPAQAPASNNAPPRIGPSKIVAQIFQTPQGPKVVIQGVNPSDLTPAQMNQLRQQIQRQLTASGIGQNAQVPTMLAGTATSTTADATPPSLSNGDTSATAASAEAAAPTSESTAVAQAPVTETVSTSSSTTDTTTQLEQKPVTNQSPLLSHGVTAASLAAQQANSPIETLRSVPSNITVPHASPTPSSPIVARSPPPTMISPAKILSPPPQLLSPTKPNATMPTIPTSPVPPPAPVQTTTSTPAPVVVARKSTPRKSPIRPNNIDSPPPILPASPPRPQQASPQAHNNTNAVSNSNCNNVAASLMQPLNSEQQVILAERRNSLKEEIMEKKKAAATRMKMNAQREIQEEKERQNALEVTNNKIEEVKRPMTTVKTAGGKRRKLDSNSEDAPGRNSSSIERGAGGSMRGRGRGPRGGGRGGNRKRKLYCVCKTPYDKDKFYVGCDKCDNWFHGDCIGITEEMSRDLPEYICDDCRDDKLYCFCKKPYNESQFYIQCDKCDDWFHGRCVGVLQGEAESIGDYSCPGCEPDSPINFPNMKKLDSTDYLSISRVLKELLQNRSSIPFRKPVTKSQAPNYFNIIKEPIDLQMVSSRVDDRKYERLKDFVGDVGKIFENCRYYNDQTTDIFRYADNLEKFFVQKICAVRQTFNTRVR